MRRSFVAIGFTLAALFIFSNAASAAVGTGLVTASPGLDIQLFGSLKTFPTFGGNFDFNKNNTDFDWLLDESGYIDNDQVTVRNEFRLGVKGAGENWDFIAILESDFALDKDNVDRGARKGEISNDIGMTGEDFGVEKLKFTYDFNGYGLPMAIETGWQTNYLDLETGGLLYGDDHPFIGLTGKYNDISWETMALLVYDSAASDGNGTRDDWQVYTGKMTLPAGSFKISPFYAYSDNHRRSANVHYIGVQAYGKMGMLIPSAEAVYATGNKENYTADGGDADISAYGGFAALQVAVSDAFNPYFGGYIISGDDDANDDEINAFNPITNISRYSGTFGMENAFIYRYVPVIGSHLYSNTFDTLGGAGTGYGGISDSASANSPGMYSLGLGAKGAIGKWAYKAQFQYFLLAEAGALEDVTGNSIDSNMGWEIDWQLTYNFSRNFSIGNVISVFDPGQAVQDLRGEDFDQMALLDTVELTWNF